MGETERLLSKLRSGTCTPAELQALRTLLKAEGDLAAWLDQDLATIEHTPDQVQRARIWHKIVSALRAMPAISAGQPRPEVKRRRLLYRWGSVAAGLLLLVLAWQFGGPRSSVGTVVVASAVGGEVQKKQLPDGSVVWLNRNSKIWYTRGFRAKVRQVHLEGEAFFSVVRNAHKPFVVVAGAVQTTVLGTTFNVQAFPASSTVQVALRTGKVKVAVRAPGREEAPRSTRLLPGQLFTYNKTARSFTTQTFAKNAPYAWKDGIIYFDGAKVQEVARVLENWYGITFRLEDAPRMNSELVTRFDATRLTMEQVLTGIADVTDYRFVRKNRQTILVKPD